MDSLASRYAKALFDLALEGQAVVAFQREMKEIKSVVQTHQELVTIFSHYNITNQEKKKLLKQIFADQISLLTLNFLQLLVDKKRINHLTKICDEFNALANQYRGIEEGIIYSSILLNQAEMSQIQQRIEQERKSRIELQNLVDASLIGGFKVIIKDTVYDNSLKHKINSLRYELLAGKR